MGGPVTTHWKRLGRNPKFRAAETTPNGGDARMWKTAGSVCSEMSMALIFGWIFFTKGEFCCLKIKHQVDINTISTHPNPAYA